MMWGCEPARQDGLERAAVEVGERGADAHDVRRLASLQVRLVDGRRRRRRRRRSALRARFAAPSSEALITRASSGRLAGLSSKVWNVNGVATGCQQLEKCARLLEVGLEGAVHVRIP